MVQTIAALLLAHVLADFVLQTGSMVKRKREARNLLLHFLIVIATAFIAIGRIDILDIWQPIMLLAIIHIAIDMVKIFALPKTLSAFLADQAAHLLTIATIAWFWPDIYAGGIWSSFAGSSGIMMYIAGLLIATIAGGHAIALLLDPKRTRNLPDSLPKAGRTIGFLERGIVFLLICVDWPAGIGFLVTAKSVLRFGDISTAHHKSEYVIIGTLGSIGWAMIMGWSIDRLMNNLPPVIQ